MIMMMVATNEKGESNVDGNKSLYMQNHDNNADKAKNSALTWDLQMQKYCS